METIVAIHCSGSSGAQWRSLAAALPAHRVLAPDLIGYGGSAPWSGRGRFMLADEAGPIRGVIGRLQEPVHLVGHSYGGAVALHIARTRPELVRTLTLVEPSAFHLLRSGDAIDCRALAEIRAVAADAAAALAAGNHARGFGAFVDYWSGPGSWQAMSAEKRAAFAPQLAKVALDFEAIFGEPAELEDETDVSMPTLIIQGGCTQLPSRCVCQRLRVALPNASFRVVRAAGHMSPITHREEVNALIRAHLDANEVQPRRETAALTA